MLGRDTHQPNYSSVSYHLKRFIKPAQAKVIVKKCIKLLSKMEFDAIAFRGLSGALIAPTIAMEMGKELIAVRKTKGDHSTYMVEGDRAARTYVIVDDFIGTGSTVRTMLNQIKEYAPGAECIGVLQAYYIDGITDIDCLSYEDIFTTKLVNKWKEDYQLKRNAEIVARKLVDKRKPEIVFSDFCYPITEDYSQWKTSELKNAALPPLQKAVSSRCFRLPEPLKEQNKRLREREKEAQTQLEQNRANFRARMNTDLRPSSRTTTYM